MIRTKKSHIILLFILFFSRSNSAFTGEVILKEMLQYPSSAWNQEYKKYLEKEPNWLDADWKDKIHLSKPPELTETAAEIDDMLILVPSRKQAQTAINAELEIKGIWAGFLEVVAESSHYDIALGLFMDTVFDDATRAVFYFKNHFNRARPYHYYPQLNPTIPPPGHPSYPSGHATQAYTLAFALSEVFPQLRVKFEKVAYQLSRHREIGGVHYASDSAAGKLLAIQLVKMMRKHPEFEARRKFILLKR